MTDVLFVVSEHGYWGEECIEPLARVDTAGYDAVVFPGGHGTEWDVNQDRHARALLRGPESSAAAARTLLDELGVEAPA